MISIIIPCLNEADIIRSNLNYLIEITPSEHQIIIVDGGSTDGTLEIINTVEGVEIIKSTIQSRAAQMNLGAQNADGDVLYFLHADSRPPKLYIDLINSSISEGIDLGNFSVLFDPSSFLLKINEWVTRQAYLYEGGGDQSLFIKKCIFNELNGFDELYTIMEEYEFLSRAKKKYNFKLNTKQAVITSSRKYNKNNYLKIQLSHAYIMVLYRCGVSPEKLKRVYNALLN